MFDHTHNSNISGTFIDNSRYYSWSPDEFPGLSLLNEKIAVDTLHKSRKRQPLPQCHPETRSTIIETISSWVTAPDDSGSVLLLQGSMGSGKSAIAQKVADIYASSRNGPPQLLASYFFSWKSEETCTTTALVSTVAYQIITMLPEIKQFMDESISQIRPSIFSISLEDQVQVLIVNPIRKAIELGLPSIPRLIIIDALNECKSLDEQKHIINTICGLVESHALPLRFLITCRPQQRLKGIVRQNANNRVLSLDDDPALNAQDVERYFRSELNRIRVEWEISTDWPIEEDIKALLQRGPEGFIYPSLLVRFIDLDDRKPEDQMRLMLNIPIQQNIATSPFVECYNFVTILGEDHITNTLTKDTLSRPYGVCMVNPLFRDNGHHLQTFVFSFLQKYSTEGIRQILMDVHKIYVPHYP